MKWLLATVFLISSCYAKPITFPSLLRPNLENPKLFKVCDDVNAYPGVSIFMNFTIPTFQPLKCTYSVDKINTNMYRVKTEDIEIDITLKDCFTNLGYFYVFTENNILYTKFKSMYPWVNEDATSITQEQLANAVKDCSIEIDFKHNKNTDITTINPDIEDEFSGDEDNIYDDEDDYFNNMDDVVITPINFTSNFLKKIHDFEKYTAGFGMVTVSSEVSMDELSVFVTYGDMCQNLKTSFVTSGSFDRFDVINNSMYVEYPVTYNYEDYTTYFYNKETTLDGTFCYKE
ncbi:chemokine binding protein [Hypsugopox virus]|nr:chemokine binding protein [Hypsugopox virus]